ncbi:MAG: molybdopterin-dependent oxidoreductase [Acidimicrobiia bacterium]
MIEISGAVAKSFAVPLAALATLPRRELTADFHCVAGWSATHLRWEGVAFETFYRMIIEPSVQPDTSVTHLVFEGLDGYRSIVSIEDALADDVLIAERLNGSPLDADHGAPARLVSPNQYGFVSTKHLCHIELHTAEPTENYHPSDHPFGFAVGQAPSEGENLAGGAPSPSPCVVGAAGLPARHPGHSASQRSRQPPQSYPRPPVTGSRSRSSSRRGRCAAVFVVDPLSTRWSVRWS